MRPLGPAPYIACPSRPLPPDAYIDRRWSEIETVDWCDVQISGWGQQSGGHGRRSSERSKATSNDPYHQPETKVQNVVWGQPEALSQGSFRVSSRRFVTISKLPTAQHQHFKNELLCNWIFVIMSSFLIIWSIVHIHVYPDFFSGGQSINIHTYSRSVTYAQCCAVETNDCL